MFKRYLKNKKIYCNMYCEEKNRSEIECLHAKAIERAEQQRMTSEKAEIERFELLSKFWKENDKNLKEQNRILTVIAESLTEIAKRRADAS